MRHTFRVLFIKCTCKAANLFLPVLCVRVGFNADPDPAFYLNADSDPRSQTNADPDPGQILLSQKCEYLEENTGR
jgi:hypothetical protein